MLQRTLLTLLIAICALSSGCASVRRELGYVLISDKTEIKLGAKFAAQIEAQQHLHPDRRLQSYIQRVTKALLPLALEDRPGIRYRVKVLDDPEQINAFAVLGGYLYVYSGLLLIAEDEAEIAGVLAHEIGHIVGRHSANQLAARFGMDFLTSLALGEDPYQLGHIASQLGSARFSRDDEREADTFGVRYAIHAGYDPHGLLRFFEKLKKLEARRRSDLEKLFASHPPTGERIRRIERLIDQYGASGGQNYRARFVRETAVLRRK